MRSSHKLLIVLSVFVALVLIVALAQQYIGANFKRWGGMGSGMMSGRNMMGSGMMSKRGMMGRMSGMMRGRSSGKWIVPGTASSVKNPLANDPNAWKEGQIIFANQCAVCHGSRGLGDGIALNPAPANLTSEAVQNQSDGALFWKITEGNPPMPSFRGTLSNKQRWQLVKFIRTLGK